MMDAKKTNLTPELKEIYDRVMNTSGGANAATNSVPPTPNPSTTGLGIAPSQPAPSSQQLPPTLQTPLPASPEIGLNTTPTNATPPPQDPMASPLEMPSMPTMPGLGGPSPAEQALSNSPARPLSEGNTFAFNGTAKAAPNPVAPTTSPAVSKKKAKISLPILIILGVIFVAVWGVFWAIILGIIPK